MTEQKIVEDVAAEVPAESLDVNVDTTQLEHEIKNLVETVKETQVIKDDDKTVSDLIEFFQDEKEKEEEEKQESEEKEEQRIEEIKELLEDEDLTEEEKEDLEKQLEQETNIKDFSEKYYAYKNSEGREIEENLLENTEHIIKKLDLIHSQNEVSNHADTVISIYGTMIFPALVIVYCFYNFFRWFT